MTSRLQNRRDTATNWTTNNPTLAAGELGYETDTKKIKVGDGSTAWTSLAYAATGTVTSITAGTGLTGGTISSSGTIAVAANVALTGPIEVDNIVASALTGTVNIDAVTAGFWYYTVNSSANFTLNFRGNSTTTMNTLLATGQSISFVVLNTNGSTAYYANAFTVDGTSITPKWSGGNAPVAGNASAIDAYSFTLIKTATSTYTLLAGLVKFA